MRIGIIGLGKMGEAILRGLQKSNDKKIEIQATTSSPKSASEASKRLKVNCHNDNAKLAQECDVILICVKPHLFPTVLKAIAPKLSAKKTLISVAGGITIEQLRDWSGGKAALVRSMPNTPGLVGAGMTLLCVDTPGTHMETARNIFELVGQVVTIEERLMDAGTAISGCGPAYAYMIIDALSDGGVKMGLPRATARLLSAQMLLGSARMVLESGEHPAALKDAVTTPGGTTIEGVAALERGKLRATLIEAVEAATNKAAAIRTGKK